METLQQLLARQRDELTNHPALKFANDSIVLQAVRSGTAGYTGEEHLGQFFERAQRELLDFVVKEAEDIIDRADGAFPTHIP